MPWDPRLRIARFPIRAHLAPFGTSITGDVLPEDAAPAERTRPPEGTGARQATGRFVLLHDPQVPESWDGPFRIVAFVRAGMDPHSAGREGFAQLAWTRLTDALREHGARYRRAGATVTHQVSASVGELAEHGAHAQLELRASWTPVPASPRGGQPPTRRTRAARRCRICARTLWPGSGSSAPAPASRRPTDLPEQPRCPGRARFRARAPRLGWS